MLVGRTTVAEKIVEVSLAFVFNCPECGQENFVRSVMHEFNPNEQEEMAEELGEKPQTGSWVTHPEHVACSRCHFEFRAVNPGELVDEKS
jgi:transcription elongation factor Elf1